MRRLLTTGAVVSACKISAGGATFDFGSLSGKQVTYVDSKYVYGLTFCVAAEEACFGTSSSLCQTEPALREGWSLGVWSGIQNWTSSSNTLSGVMIGQQCAAGLRVTSITFQCIDGDAKFVGVEETSQCKYSAVVQVPQAVCSPTVTCCVPDTFTSKRLEVGGKIAVVQRNAGTGDWYDGDYQGRSRAFLCSSQYNRCFTFNSTNCAASAYIRPPSECYGGADWTYVDKTPLVGTGEPVLTQWISDDGNYAFTMPFGSSLTSCVAVSGSAVDTSLGFSLVPDSSLWEVPQICLRTLRKG